MNNQNLGVVISNDTARKIIYGIYTVVVVIAGAVQVYYSAVHLGQPQWLTGALAVLAFLGAPIGALAAANAGTRSSTVATESAPVAVDPPASGPFSTLPTQPVGSGTFVAQNPPGVTINN